MLQMKVKHNANQLLSPDWIFSKVYEYDNFMFFFNFCWISKISRFPLRLFLCLRIDRVMMRNKKGKEVARDPSRGDGEGTSGDVDPQREVKGKGVAYSHHASDEEETLG